jgi:hypothetical protein
MILLSHKSSEHCQLVSLSSSGLDERPMANMKYQITDLHGDESVSLKSSDALSLLV